MEKVICRIKRYDGVKEWYQEYDLPYEKGKTILWALTKIREELDPTLTFSSGCRHAICGSCAVRVNGNAFLACKTSLDHLLSTFETHRLTFEPLNNFKVIRDLVVDWKPKFEKMKEVKPWLIPSKDGDKSNGFRQSAKDFHKISSPTDCILCGVCASECNQLSLNQDEYLDPFILNKAYRFAVDSRDAAPEEHIRPILENGLWKCFHCMQCVSKCPKEIDLASENAYLRQATMNMGERANKGARHAYAFVEDVKNKGRLNEVTLPLKTEGFINTMNRIPFAFRLIKKGKINPFHLPKAVEGIQEVRKIYEFAQGEKES